jgi:hypothetical protein
MSERLYTSDEIDLIRETCDKLAAALATIKAPDHYVETYGLRADAAYEDGVAMCVREIRRLRPPPPTDKEAE